MAYAIIALACSNRKNMTQSPESPQRDGHEILSGVLRGSQEVIVYLDNLRAYLGDENSTPEYTSAAGHIARALEEVFNKRVLGGIAVQFDDIEPFAVIMGSDIAGAINAIEATGNDSSRNVLELHDAIQAIVEEEINRE